MARFPGTETKTNRRGLRPADAVRCRRSRANGALGLADARGLVVEVQTAHARVLFDLSGRSVWLADEQLVDLDPAELGPEPALLRAVLRALDAQRVEFEEGGLLIVSSPRVTAAGLERAREALGARLEGLEIHPGGVHEVAVHLRIASPQPR